MINEIYAVLAVILLSAILVLLAVTTALWWVMERCWRKREVKFSPVGKLTLAGGAGVVLCFLYSLFVEPFWLDVTHVKLHTKKLQVGSKGFRIAHISDLHSDPKLRLEDQLPTAIAAEKPDIIVLTGDCVNSPEGLPNFKRFLAATSKIAPTYVVRGNWDSWYFNKLDLFGGTDAIELNGNVREIVVGDVPVSITGFAVEPERDVIPDGGEAALNAALSEVANKGPLSIVLYHYPDLIEEVSKQKVDLYFAGHTHGGQVRIPFYGALITLSKFGKKYEAGLYHVQDTTLYVNRGIGMEGGSAPRIRFLCRPELTIVDVVPDGQP